MMKNLNKIMAWGVAAILALSAAAWIWVEQSGQETELSDAAVLLDSGITLFNEKNFQQAVEALDQVPSGSPEKWQALYYQGSAMIMLKDYTSAVVYLEQALALNSHQTRIMHALGVAYFKLGNVKLAKAYYASILELDPNDEEAKGLMDIMANLERQQDGQIEEPDSGDEDAGDSSR
jgi:Flp pilus assembly protein TadD